MGEIIAIASQKGGVGKTSTSINLGASLAIFQKSVLLVDLDPQGSIAASFHLEDMQIEYGLLDIVVSKVPLAKAIADIGLEEFEIVPSNVKSEEDEVELFTHLLQPHILKSILTPVRDEYDFIILDCPPSLGTITVNALAAADSVVIPVQSEYFSLRALGKFLRSIKKIGAKYNPQLNLRGILITMLDKRLKRSREIMNELRKTFKKLIFENYIPRNAKIAEAPALGKPVALVDMTSKGSVAYFKLAEEILNKKIN
jgi:chromosome partitioning protein